MNPPRGAHLRRPFTTLAAFVPGRGPLTGWLAERAINPLAVRAASAKMVFDLPPPDPVELRPWTTGRRYGFSHVNVVVPDLPAPHRFLACMVIVGQPGMRIFDIDAVVQGSPRNTAMVTNGTAAAGGLRVYAVDAECDLRADGSRWRFGDELEIAGAFPRFAVQTRRDDLHVDLELECTDRITWFARSPFYDHYGFPARYTGTIAGDAIAGVASLEYARGMTPALLRDRPVPARLKLPWDFFTYQVLTVAPDTLVMLTRVGAFGRPMLATAYVRQLDGDEGRWVSGIDYEVLDWFPEPFVSPGGAVTRVASRWRWTWPAGQVEVTADTRMHPGLGTGWIGGAAYAGEVRGRRVAGRGYVEYGDQRVTPPRRDP